MRELNIGTKQHTKVIAFDERGAGNANHEYMIKEVLQEASKRVPHVLCTVNFQTGPIKENGINGVHNEDLIAIVIDRMQGFQAGEYRCRENALALEKLEEALRLLNKRTRDREDRGVEGTSVI